MRRVGCCLTGAPATSWIAGRSSEPGAQSGFVVTWRMRYRIEIPPRHAALIACAVALVGLVYAEGWIWPLKAAAFMIPVSLLVG